MQTHIRTAVEADVSAILSVWRELMEFHSGLDPQYRLVADATAQVRGHLNTELTTPASLVVVAQHDFAIIGYCRASVRQQSPIFEQRVHGFISELHVLSSFRRRGVGRSLFQYVQRWLSEQGVQRVEVVTLSANDVSAAFWQNVGCQTYAERRFLTLAGA